MTFGMFTWSELRNRLIGFTKGVALSCAVLMPASAHANSGATLNAFVKFLAQGDYENANFYLQNNLINPESLETGQIFYDIVRNSYWQRLEASTTAITTLYGYLSQIREIDVNAEFACTNRLGEREESKCRLLHDLVTGKPARVIAFFADLGLDLNRTFADRPPATFDVIDRFGYAYTVADIQLLSQKGMAFGDEIYDPVILAAFREYRYRDKTSYQQQDMIRPAPRLPSNYLSIQQFNFMDVLALALGNPVERNNRPIEESSRDDTLCQYITYVASQMAPSFDYLQFILLDREEFRAALIGVRKRQGNRTYEPFPSSCVALMSGMAQNHGRLNEVIEMFGARGDVDTARWLVSLKAPQAAQGIQPLPGQISK
jgi:hypothetical protein